MPTVTKRLYFGRGGENLSDFIAAVSNHLPPHLAEYSVKTAIKDLVEIGFLWPPFRKDNVRQIVQYIGCLDRAAERAKNNSQVWMLKGTANCERATTTESTPSSETTKTDKEAR